MEGFGGSLLDAPLRRPPPLAWDDLAGAVGAFPDCEVAFEAD